MMILYKLGQTNIHLNILAVEFVLESLGLIRL